MADINLGDVTARIRADTTDFTRGLQSATQQLNALRQQSAQTGQAISQLPFTAVQTAIDTFSRASLNAGNSQTQLRQALTQAQQAMQQFGVTTDASGQMVDRFGTRLSTPGAEQLRGFSAGIKETQAQLGQLQRFGIDAGAGMSRFGETVRGALSFAAGLGIATSLVALANVVKNLASESVTLALRMEGLNLAFRAIDGSAEAANRTMTFLFTTAQRLGVDFLSVADGFKRMDAAAKGTSLEGEGVRQVFAQITAGATRLGVSSEQLSQALVAIEQIMTKGKLSAEEYRRQLGNAIPGALERMAEGFGRSTQVLERFVAAGIIPANAAIVAFGEGMVKLSGGETQEPVNRLSATFNRLTNETKAWMAAIGDGLGSIIKPWLDVLVKISEKIREIFSIPIPGTTAAPRPGTTGAPLGVVPNQYTDLIAQSARKEVVDPGLLSRLIQAESGFNPNAVSPAGAIGLGQLMLPTAQSLQVGVTAENLREPERNVSLAAKYLADMIDMFRGFNDQVKLALAAYNAGPGNVQKAIAATRAEGQPITYENVLPRLPKPGETGPYVERVLAPQAPIPQPAIGPPTPQVEGAVATGSAGAKVLDEMVKAQEKSLALLPQLQQQFEALATSGLNVGGVLNEALTKQAQDAVKEFTQIAERLTAFPELMARLTPVQQEQLAATAKQVALFKQRADEVVKSPELALLTTQIEQLEALTIRRRADRIEREQGQEAADRFTRAETAALALRQLATQREQALLPRTDQLAAAQARLSVLTLETQALGAQGEAEEDSLRRREAIMALEHRLREQEVEALKHLQEMKAAVSLTAAAQKELTAAKIAATFLDNETIQTLALEVQALTAEKTAMLESFTAIKQRTDATREAMDRQSAFRQQLQDRLVQLQTPQGKQAPQLQPLSPDDRPVFTAEESAEIAASLRARITAQERLNYITGIFEQLGNSVGSAWTNALMSIANGTATVAGAFKSMAQSILQSLAQIASQEAFKSLIRLGVGLIGSAFAPGAGSIDTGATIGSGGTANPPPLLFAQGGAIVNRPTTILAGENPSMNPEYVVNHPQMQKLMATAISSAGPSAGGQAPGVTIINVPTRAQAEEEKGRQEALGRRAIINEVLADMAQGESSKIVRMMRTTAR